MVQSIDQQGEYVAPAQQAINVAFQGERGAFGDEAVRAYFGSQAQPIPYRSFADVFRAVARSEVEAGLVPVENSQAGSINEVYDLLRQYDLFVTGEIGHPVNHCLLCLPGQQLSDIKRVISHPQALAQSDVYLRELNVEIVATYDTAGSAKMVREENLRAGEAKTMLVMATAHQPGSLHTCLGVLAANQINLLKLESRPSRHRIWEYVFYLDFEGHRDDPLVSAALADLAGYTTFCKVLGSFARNA